jgi:hypothetical protein
MLYHLPIFMRILVLIAITALLNSCASVINSTQKQIEVITTTPAKVVLGSDTLAKIDGQIVFLTDRKPDPLVLTVLDKSTSKTITIDSKSEVDPMQWTTIFVF